ncbi:hypothetical protein H0H92_008777, partial [Tricholoma furcatifolium]
MPELWQKPCYKDLLNHILGMYSLGADMASSRLLTSKVFPSGRRTRANLTEIRERIPRDYRAKRNDDQLEHALPTTDTEEPDDEVGDEVGADSDNSGSDSDADSDNSDLDLDPDLNVGSDDSAKLDLDSDDSTYGPWHSSPSERKLE